MAHLKAEHPSPGQKAANTRRRNEEAKDKLAAEAKARMAAASEWVIERTHYMGPSAPYGYDMKLTYQVEANEYRLGHYRRPTVNGLKDIEYCEQEVARAQRALEYAISTAWETGAPVTEAEVLAARAAGAVTP
jgi:hypothetical protein